MARKLVISFTGLLYAIKSGAITAEDLEDALFYFGCTRIHAMQPGADGEANELEWVTRNLADSEALAERQSIHGIVIEALEKAEQEGRVTYREFGVSNTIEQLNLLLAANGITQIEDTERYYSYPYVEDRVAFQNIPLDVVWR